MSWLKWYHLGVPDNEGTDREEIREELAEANHCMNCTVLSGCYFPINNLPIYPRHPYCDCFLYPIMISESAISAICDIRKFTEYLFNYDKNNGKAYLFESWGFNVGDSQTLKDIFEMQAKEKYLSGDFILQKNDRYGQRITINIRLQDDKNNDRVFKTGWLVHPLGKITCTTVFSGVV